MSKKSLIDRALYPLSEAARLAGTTASALARWSSPYEVKRHYAGPQLKRPLIVPTSQPDGLKLFSFLNLIEAHFAVAYRRSGVSLRSIQIAVEFVREQFGDDHPLRRGDFLTDGKNLFHVAQEEYGLSGLVTASGSGQLAWPSIVDEFLLSIDRDEARSPIRWWPRGRDRAIVIDPRFAFGYPVVANRYVRTDALAERFEAGEDVDAIALDFGLEKSVVEEAVRYELMLQKAA